MYLFSPLFLLACTETPSTKEDRREGMVAGDCTDHADNDGDGAFDCVDDGCGGSADCTAEPSAPTGLEVAIEPTSPEDADNLECVLVAPAVDPNGDTVTHTFAWSVDGEDSGLATNTVSAAITRPGHTWTCSVVASDGVLTSAPATATAAIAPDNTAPSAPQVTVLPAAPVAGDGLTCAVVTASVDPDGDSVAYRFAWRVDGADEGLATAAVDEGRTLEGETWTCEVTATDGLLESEAVRATVTIGPTCASGAEACPAPSCAALLAGGVTSSGTYWVGSSASAAPTWCDMSTDGGGWTRVWTHDGATDYDSIGLTYAVDAPELFRDATEALVAYVDGTETTGSYWASFPLPEDWRTTTPMAQPHVDTQVDARVAGRDVGRVGLHYGYANVAYGSGGCSALTWNTGTYGTVCLEDPMAPWFNGFAASLSGAPGDYCSLATGTHDATRCTTSRRFALSVR